MLCLHRVDVLTVSTETPRPVVEALCWSHLVGFRQGAGSTGKLKTRRSTQPRRRVAAISKKRPKEGSANVYIVDYQGNQKPDQRLRGLLFASTPSAQVARAAVGRRQTERALCLEEGARDGAADSRPKFTPTNMDDDHPRN